MSESRPLEGLSALGHAIPAFAEIGEVSTIEDQARAVLALLLDRAALVDTAPLAIVADPRCCPNCGQPSESTKSPYCCESCREIAGFVRQFRADVADGTLLDREKQVAFGQNLWNLLGGGRPLRQSLVLDRARESVFKREGGKCQECGAPAKTVDHAVTGCNRPINLRAVCGDCCRDRPFGDAAVMASPTYAQVLEELASRVGSPEAIRCCDDQATWDWRAYVKARKSVLENAGP